MDRESFARLRRKWRKRIRERAKTFTVVGVLVFVIPFVPNTIGIAEAWYGYAKKASPLIVSVFRFIGTPIGYLAFGALGIILIWWDQNRITKGRKVVHDRDTLKGRVLILRDEMQRYLEAAPKEEAITPEMNQDEILEAASRNKRIPNLRWGYRRRFEHRVNDIFWEFGERSATPLKLAAAMDWNGQIEEFYTRLIQVLAEVAEMPQAED